MQHIPRKRFGQNFLIDSNVVDDIVRAIRPCEGDLMVEIGPGLGALTEPLLQSLGGLHVLEIDRDIVSRLRRDFSERNLTIYEGDALAFDFSIIGKNQRVVGNLPYNISTPVLFHLSRFVDDIQDMHFMLQKEVVARMVARPSTPSYGRLSVMLQSRFEMEQLLVVSSHSFRPEPKVESAFIRMIPLRKRPIETGRQNLFSEIVSAAFSQRRKTLRNALRAHLFPKDYLALDIDPSLRAENLSVKQFVAIVNYLSS